MSQDRIYSLPLDRVGDFVFDESVVEVFPDMIARSVPGYGSILSMVAEFAERYVKPQTQVFDLGCSLGAATLLVRERVPSNALIHAIDSSPAMVSRLTQILENQPRTTLAKVSVQEADLRDIDIRAASFAILNFTLQFIPVSERSSLLSRIAKGLIDGGALVLSEKVHFDDEHTNELTTELHHEFKKANGYSDLEIAQKRSALENTLITETVEQHINRLKVAGFSKVAPWFQCFNFVSILAVK